ncbi:MAG: 3'-5' exonuclease, partial [Micrococcaceae bacterium]
RFRKADIKLYNKVKRHFFSEDTGLLNLTKNFRSQKPIIDWVNEHFEFLMSEEGIAENSEAGSKKYVTESAIGKLGKDQIKLKEDKGEKALTAYKTLVEQAKENLWESVKKNQSDYIDLLAVKNKITETDALKVKDDMRQELIGDPDVELHEKGYRRERLQQKLEQAEKQGDDNLIQQLHQEIEQLEVNPEFDFNQILGDYKAGTLLANWEGKYLARKIHEIVNAEESKYQYSDVAILFPARTRLNLLLKALQEEKIPYNVSDSIELFNTPLIHQAVLVLQASAHPHDEFTAVNVLTGPFIGCSYEDIVKWRYPSDGSKKRSLSWQFISKFEEVDGVEKNPVYLGLKWLEHLHNLALTKSVYEAFSAILDGNISTENKVLQQVETAQAESAKLLIAQICSGDGTHSINSLLEIISTVLLNKERDRIYTPAISGEKTNAVQLMTIHQAKGLEFPIVGIFGTHAKSKANDMPLWDAEDILKPLTNLEENINDKEFGKKYYKIMNSDAAKQEFSRLFYVAFTRAEDILIVPKLTDADLSADSIDDKNMALSQILAFDLILSKPVKTVESVAKKGYIRANKLNGNRVRNAAVMAQTHYKVKPPLEFREPIAPAKKGKNNEK